MREEKEIREAIKRLEDFGSARLISRQSASALRKILGSSYGTTINF